MSNSLATSTIVAKEALAVLKNMLGFANGVNRDFQDEFGANQSRGYSPGQTINIKKPPRYTYRAGRVSVPQSTTETTIPLTLTQGGCDLGFSSLDMTLNVQQLERKIQAAVAVVANEIDRQGCDLARLASFNILGTPGTLPSTQALAMTAITGMNQRLDEMAAPRDRMRSLVMNPAFNGAIVTGMSGMFNGQSKLTDQFSSGIMVDSLGLAYSMDQNVVTHTNGTQAVTGTAVAAGLSGASIACVALGGTITKGSKVTFPGVFAVNPQSRTSTGTLAQFTITADLAAAAVALPISPAMVTSGAFQNVSGPTTAANFAIFGTASGGYGCNVAYHRDAFTLAMVPFAAPMAAGGIEIGEATDQGLSLKVTKYYDPINDYSGMRLDALFGWAAPYPELAVLFAT